MYLDVIIYIGSAGGPIRFAIFFFMKPPEKKRGENYRVERLPERRLDYRFPSLSLHPVRRLNAI